MERYRDRLIKGFRRSSLFLFLAALLLTALVSCHPGLSHTRREVRKELRKQPGTFAVAYQDLSTGERILINEKEVFHAASTMKTPVLIEVYKQAAHGKFSLSDSVLIKNKFESIVDGSMYELNAEGDSEKELYGWIGRKRTVRDLCYRMITSSSNLSTNLLIEKVGADHVTQTMRDLGAEQIQVRRGVEDSKAYEKNLNNTTTAFDLMIIFLKISVGEAGDDKSCADMTTILLGQKFNEIIPAKLPSGIKVAHKTGSLTGIHHDSGIVFIPDGRKYVIVILSKDLVDEASATEAMANVSKLIYRHVIARPK